MGSLEIWDMGYGVMEECGVSWDRGIWGLGGAWGPASDNSVCILITSIVSRYTMGGTSTK